MIIETIHVIRYRRQFHVVFRMSATFTMFRWRRVSLGNHLKQINWCELHPRLGLICVVTFSSIPAANIQSLEGYLLFPLKDSVWIVFTVWTAWKNKKSEAERTLERRPFTCFSDNKNEIYVRGSYPHTYTSSFSNLCLPQQWLFCFCWKLY